MVLVCIRGYLKSFLRYKIYNSGFLSSGHSTFAWARLWKFVAIFRSQKHFPFSRTRIARTLPTKPQGTGALHKPPLHPPRSSAVYSTKHENIAPGHGLKVKPEHGLSWFSVFVFFQPPRKRWVIPLPSTSISINHSLILWSFYTALSEVLTISLKQPKQIQVFISGISNRWPSILVLSQKTKQRPLHTRFAMQVHTRRVGLSPSVQPVASWSSHCRHRDRPHPIRLTSHSSSPVRVDYAAKSNSLYASLRDGSSLQKNVPKFRYSTPTTGHINKQTLRLRWLTRALRPKICNDIYFLNRFY